MTREEIMVLGFEELEERANAIAVETAEADQDQLETLNAELDAIEERKKALNIEIEERKKTAEAVANGAGKEVEERKDKKMTSRELRSTPEYVDAYVEYVKRGYKREVFDAEIEKRTTGGSTDWTNVITSQNVPVPSYLEDRISAAWERDEIMNRVRRTYFPGIVGVAVETSSEDAVVHNEDGPDVPTEALGIEPINLVPEYIKKMVRVTHNALELTGTAFLDYLYDEIQYKIVKKAGAIVVGTILDSQNRSYTAAGATLTTADIINAEGTLAGDANPVLITTRANAAALKAAALSANYGYDPFDGLEVLYVDAAVFSYGQLAVVADLSAIQANFPDGAEPKFIFDEFTEAPANIVRIIGRLAVGIGLIAPAKVASIIPHA